MNANQFQDMINPIQDKLYRFACSFLHNYVEAEDVVQDVIIKLWERRNRLDEIENKEAWLMRATRNKCIDIKRAKGRNSASLDDVLHIETRERSPDELTESKDTMNRITAYMNELSDTQKSVLTLRDIEGYTYDEITEVLEITLSQVKINLHRARKKMREILVKAQIHGTR